MLWSRDEEAVKLGLLVSITPEWKGKRFMARRVVNRKELRAEAEAAEAAGTKKKTTTRRTRKKEPAEVRRKAMWGVFSQSLKRVATFEYSEKDKADKKAEDLSSSGKSPHFVQLVKEEIVEE